MMFTRSPTTPSASAAETTAAITTPRAALPFESDTSLPPRLSPLGREFGMAHRAVTADARDRVLGPVGVVVEGHHRVHDLLVAMAAGFFGDRAVARGDADRLVEPAGREHEGMA